MYYCGTVSSDVQNKFGIVNDAVVYAVYNYDAMASDELSFKDGDELIVIRKDNNSEKEWWFCRMCSKEGYVPRNYLAVFNLFSLSSD